MARPNLSYLKNFILVLVGIPMGVLTGLTGTVPSAVAGPSVRYLLGLRDNRASAAALLTTLAAAVASLLSYHQMHSTPWLFALVIMIGQLLGAALGQLIALSIPLIARSRPFFGLLTIVLGIAMMVSRGHPVSLLHPGGISFGLVGLACVLGVVVGTASRWLEMGGVLTVPALIYAFGLPVHVAQGAAILVLLFASLPTALSYIGRQEVENRSASWMPFGAIFGALIGAHYASLASASGLIRLDGLVISLFGLVAVFYKNPPITPFESEETDDERPSDL